MDIFPAPVEDHRQATVANRLVQDAARASHRIVVFTEHSITPLRRLVAQKRQERAAFEDVRARLAAEPIYKRRRQINRLNEIIANLPACRICLWRGVHNDERHPGGGVVEQLFFAQPVIAKVIAVILSKDDQRVFGDVVRIQPSHQPEPPHLNWSSAMFRKRRTDNDEQTTEAGRDYHEVEAS